MLKFKHLLSIVLIFTVLISKAAWLNFEPQIIWQPDGTEIHCFATGDEFYNWLHDSKGFTIVQDQNSGFYYYAILNNGALQPSSWKVGSADPETLGLTPWINISPEQMSARRVEFLKNQMPEKPVIPGFDPSESTRNIGTLNNLVVYIRFSDQNEFTDDTTLYTNMFNNPEPGYSSMLNYFREVSYNKLTVPSHFYPVPPTNLIISYQDIYPRSYFMPYHEVTNPDGYQEWERGEREFALLKRAVEYIAGEVPPELDIDYNNDGLVDNVVFVIKGQPTAWATLLWPHRWVLYGEEAYINGYRVWDFNFQLTASLSSSGNGVLCHEMFHSLGSPDLYHYNSTPVDPIGNWDIMCANNNPPQSMGAYMKFRYGGWIDEIPEITECGTYTLNPVADEQNNAFKIASPNSNTDIFIVEYRKKAGTFEGTLTASGLLIYKINTLLDGEGNAQGPPDEVYIYRPNGTNYVNGNLNEAVFAADYGRTAFNDTTNPMSFLSNDAPAGIDISEIGFIGETISFKVTLDKQPVAGLSASETLITEGCSIHFTDESLCHVNSWEWTFPGGNPSTSTEQNPQGITYATAGLYPVTLKVTNDWGSNTIVFENYVTVSNTAQPVADFMVSDSIICTGEVVKFTDLSAVCPDSWQWSIIPDMGVEFINGTSATSQNPEVVFNEPYLQFAVKLVVNNANGTSEIMKEAAIAAGGICAHCYTATFEAPSMAATGWTVENPDNKKTWGIYETGGSISGNKSAGIGLFDYYSFGQRDRLISPPLNMTLHGDYHLSFRHAYAQTVAAYSDSLIVNISTDCGTNWTRLLALAENGSSVFATRPPLTSTFVPETEEDWCGQPDFGECYTMDISEYQANANVMIMFESVKGVGNNLFIDDVRIDLYTGTSNGISANESRFRVFPNPGNGLFTITLSEPTDYLRIEVLDMQGKSVTVVHGNSTINSYELNLQSLPKGMYFLKLATSGITETRKIILTD